MFKRLNTGFSHRIVPFLLALYLFNLSIDPRDPQAESISENLSVNDIESFCELILETVIGIDNAVPEHEEHDTDTNRVNHEFRLFFSCSIDFINSERTYLLTDTFRFAPVEKSPVSTLIEIESPPPQV